ncbi:MAG: S41 family peptidase [Saprospiraceae bacterium]|nr:S41 family peptidase [Saprospiraceae bacterium]
MKIYLQIAIATLFSTTLIAQNECTCEQVFDKMIEKLEANYIAYHITKNEISSAYEMQKQKYNTLIKNTPISDCVKTLQGFLDFFKDGHLFVVEFPKFPEEELIKHKAFIKENAIDIKNISPGNKKSIEGYWTDGESKFAIIKNNNLQIKEEYIAVIIDTKDKTKIGEIKFEVSFSNNKWEGTYYTNTYTPRYVNITPYKDNNLLNIWGGILWGRLDSKDAAMYNPVSPNIKSLDKQTIVMTIPSFLIEKKDFDKVLNDNETLFENAENLIIDIRGNSGGNGIYFNLLRYYYEKPALSGRGWAISSDDNIAYFQRFVRNNSNDPYAPVVAEMQENKGKLVKGPIFQPLELEAKKTNIKKVVILTDRGNMSAAETFILYSKAVSNKVITMGEHTGGVVDYNNVNMIPLNCEKQGIHFGYPTYTLHDKIPKEGYNKTGILPDIRIKNNVKDKIAFIINQLEKY